MTAGHPGLQPDTYSSELPVSSIEHATAPMWGLGCYLRTVADALGLPSDAANWEIAEEASAYVALDGRIPRFPDRNLMLIWHEARGWLVATEPDGSHDSSTVVARLRGDIVPRPGAVAAFVHGVMSGRYEDVPTPPGAHRDPAYRLALYHYTQDLFGSQSPLTVAGEVHEPSTDRTRMDHGDADPVTDGEGTHRG